MIASKRISALSLSILMALPLAAQTNPTEALVGAGTADRAIEAAAGGRALAQIEASSDDSSATIKTGWTLSKPKGIFSTFSLGATAPLSKSGPTALASPTGFPNAFTVTGKYTRHILATRNPFDDPVTAAERQRLCDEAEKKIPIDEDKQGLIDLALKLGRSEAEAVEYANTSMRAKRLAELKGIALDHGKTKDEATAFADKQLQEEIEEEETASEFECGADIVAKLAPELLAQFNALYFNPNKAHRFWGASATVGHASFDYLSADLSEGKASKTPWGASLFGAIIPSGTQTLITAGFEHREKFKDADAQTICPQDSAATQLTCKTGPFGAPVDATEELAFVEVRRFIRSKAVSLKVAYDFEAENVSLDLPVYLIRTSDDGLAGGVRVAWAEGDGAQLSVFVSSAFSMFPKH